MLSCLPYGYEVRCIAVLSFKFNRKMLKQQPANYGQAIHSRKVTTVTCISGAVSPIRDKSANDEISRKTCQSDDFSGQMWQPRQSGLQKAG